MHRGACAHDFIHLRVSIRNAIARLPPVLSPNAHTYATAVACATESSQDKGAWRQRQKLNMWCEHRMCVVALDSTVPETKPLGDGFTQRLTLLFAVRVGGAESLLQRISKPDTQSRGYRTFFFSVFLFVPVNVVMPNGNDRDRLRAPRLTVQPCPAAAPQLVCSGQMSLVCQ